MTVKRLISLLKKYLPEVECALNYSSPEELLVATILSAQCTDKRVNIVTETLFRKYKVPEDLATIDVKILEAEIRSTGFYKNKAKNIKSCCSDLVDKYNSKVKPDIDVLQGLAGVGRKTANVVIGECYGNAQGIVVDTHVKRVSKRLGLTNSISPVVIEKDLMLTIPKRNWIIFSHWMIHLGRGPCKARKTHCEDCFLKNDCPSSLF